MMAQIDRLSPTDRTVLRGAAVIGARFTKELVDASLAPEAPGPDAWERLSDFLVEEADGHLRFRHALVRDAAYEGLPSRRRREVHGRVGETIEARAADRPEDEAELLSLHFFHAHDFGKAWRYSQIAGERAAAIYANVEAAAFFERALQAARRRRDVAALERAKVLEALGDVRVRLSEFEKAARAYRMSRRRRGADPVEEARVILKEAQVPSWLGKSPQALRRISRGLGVLDGLEDTGAAAERARLYALYAAVRTRQGRLLDTIKWCRLAVEEAEAAGARDALAHAYFLLDWAYASLGRYDEAVYSPLALDIYEELGNLHRQGLVLNNMGVFAHFQGRWEDALDLYKRAEQAWAKMGDRWHVALATLNVGEVLADQGRVDEAEPLLRDALRVARASHSGPLLGDVTLRLGRLLSRSGRFEEAHALLAEAREQYELEADARIAERFVLEGEPRAALDLSTGALERGRSFDGGFDVIVMLQRVQGCALLQLGRLDEARVALGAALDEARKRSADYEVALVLDALTALAHLTGEPTEELDHERDAILGRLGVVKIPDIPLPKLSTKAV
jgi:tetratricopeptide (TPR) repeat protein